ncbi:RagB/SusD family nutrient uptake outer membrane protein [Pontibacter sp. 13R65]|uniref:RagB/SusD family nutrient uptake outer membrane protein n=1 Tax=Pontibacter sp. 13R65 TaxID=3127458 RepID=UPI00301CF179
MNRLRIKSKIFFLPVVAAMMLCQSSCKDDLLDQQPTDQLGAAAFWKTTEDATYALHGAYAAVRPLFDRDYYFEGQTEFVRIRGVSASTSGNLRLGAAYTNGNFRPTGYASSFDDMYRFLYGGVHRTNYVIDNVKRMLPTATPGSVAELETVIAEARLLRGMVYFRLISMWGDVPYIGHQVFDNSEVATLARLPIAQVKDSIMADFTYAYEKLPIKPTAVGRAGKPAALAFRGKLQLYWASWNKFGWPELENFKPDAAAADVAYLAAAADFKAVIDNFGLTLFRGGEPGNVGELGKADVLPNYYYLFTPIANGDPEMIMSFTHGGVGTGQGEELMRDFAGRSHENSQVWVSPRYEIADRYQSTLTGDFAPKLIPMDANIPGARTTPNSAVNPQSYANRDYRMKSSIMWDYEMSMGMNSLKETGMVPFIFRTWGAKVVIDGVEYTTYNTDGTNSGYVFRKFVRNYAGQGRSEGDFAWPVMRLADVYLMYAEATNAVNGPQADAIELVNRVRHRGNLPPLGADKVSGKEAFFAAIEQERIIELYGEGHRAFDLRRWRALERVWGQPGGEGVWSINTYGSNVERYYQNTQEREYQQNYIFRIPPGERDRNPNLTQNTPWL